MKRTAYILPVVVHLIAMPCRADGTDARSMTYSYYYNNLDQITSTRIMGDEFPQQFNIHWRAYDTVGQLSSTGTENLAMLTYRHDVAGRVDSIGCVRFINQILSYTPGGRVGTLRTYVGDYMTTFRMSYDNAGRWIGSQQIASDSPHRVDHSMHLEYDRNSNVIRYDRNGISSIVNGVPRSATVDDLDFTYGRGGRLRSVVDDCGVLALEASNDFVDLGEDSSDEFTYDAAGRMTSDDNRGITSITYNPLGLPSKIVSKDGPTLHYVYDANGYKWVERFVNNLTVKPLEQRTLGENGSSIHDGLPLKNLFPCKRYLPGGFIYEDNRYVELLTAHGYKPAGREWHQYVKDYQGNIVAVLAADSAGRAQAVQRTFYYLDGVPMAESIGLHESLWKDYL